MAITLDHSAALTRIAAAMNDCDADFETAAAMPHTNDVEHAVRARRLALICARKVAWWRVLDRLTSEIHGLHYLFRAAVRHAVADERSDARFWRDAAKDWAARAVQVPTSDAAGALSNWHELGVSA